MKKLLYVLFAFVLCLGMNSCKKEAAPKDDAAETEKAAVEEKEADPPSMADIVAKAKAEGANWTVDEWKEQFKAMALATKGCSHGMPSIENLVLALTLPLILRMRALRRLEPM